MPHYTYQAYNSEGKRIQGNINAENMPMAKENLRGLGLTLVHLREDFRSQKNSQLQGDDLCNFTMQLAELLSAQVPLYESLLAMEEQARGEKYHAILSTLASEIKAGKSLSQAMQLYPNSFSALYCSMVGAGESSGTLDSALKKLSSLISKQQKMRKQILSALTYPIVLALFSLIVISVLIGFVLPSIENLFEGRALPAFTQCILMIAHFLRSYGWLILLLVIPMGSLLFSRRGQIGAGLLTNYFIRVPLLRSAIVRSSLSRFSRTLGTLLEGGVSMINSLEMATKTLNNPLLEAVFHQAQERVIEGRRLSQELSKSPLIPSLFWRMIAIGEESGSLPQMLTHCAHLYEEDTERTLNKLVALVQPAILLIMGLIVGIILLAVLLPLSDLSSIAGI